MKENPPSTKSTEKKALDFKQLLKELLRRKGWKTSIYPNNRLLSWSTITMEGDWVPRPANATTRIFIASFVLCDLLCLKNGYILVWPLLYNISLEKRLTSLKNTKSLKDSVIFFKLQWNQSKVDTYGTEVFVCFREVSPLERFELKSSQI